MSELPLRESDIDLVPLLRKCTNEELEPLVQYIIKNGSITSELQRTEVYKNNVPNHTAYVDEICAEIQRFGGHSAANILRGGEGEKYKNIVCEVAKRLKVNFNKKQETEFIEEQIVLKIVYKAWEKMTDEQRVEFGKSIRPHSVKIGPEFPWAAFLAIFKAGGFTSYKILVIVSNAVWKYIFGKTAPFAFYTGLTRGASIVVGPIGWAITIMWTLFDLGSPAYRVTVPCVIHIAMLRKRVQLREAGVEIPPNKPLDSKDKDLPN